MELKQKEDELHGHLKKASLGATAPKKMHINWFEILKEIVCSELDPSFKEVRKTGGILDGIRSTLFGATLLPHQKPEWLKADRYYVCQGVKKGVAKGNTSPVPDCFEKEEERSARTNKKTAYKEL